MQCSLSWFLGLRSVFSGDTSSTDGDTPGVVGGLSGAAEVGGATLHAAELGGDVIGRIEQLVIPIHAGMCLLGSPIGLNLATSSMNGSKQRCRRDGCIVRFGS